MIFGKPKILNQRDVSLFLKYSITHFHGNLTSDKAAFFYSPKGAFVYKSKSLDASSESISLPNRFGEFQCSGNLLSKASFRMFTLIGKSGFGF